MLWLPVATEVTREEEEDAVSAGGRGHPRDAGLPVPACLSLLLESVSAPAAVPALRFGLGGSCRRRPCWRLPAAGGKEPAGWEKSRLFPRAGRRNTRSRAVGTKRLCGRVRGGGLPP